MSTPIEDAEIKKQLEMLEKMQMNLISNEQLPLAEHSFSSVGYSEMAKKQQKQIEPIFENEELSYQDMSKISNSIIVQPK